MSTKSRVLLCVPLVACGAQDSPPLPRNAPSLPAHVEAVQEEAVATDPGIAEELLTLGGDLRDAQRELADASSVVFFLDCLEDRTGKTVNGTILEHHIRRNTKHAKACQAEYLTMSESERTDYVMAWVATQEAKQGVPK